MRSALREWDVSRASSVPMTLFSLWFWKQRRDAKANADSILVFGENADPQSKHYFDQARLYANQQFKPAWVNLDDIQAHTERKYHPGE